MPREEDLVAKYDRLAATYSSRYADPGAVARFYVRLLSAWLVQLAPGARVLEVSCADGFMTEALTRAGFEVVGIDISPRMVEVARRRLAEGGLTADLRVADINSFELDREVDALLAPMWTFYSYVDDPVRVLSRLAPRVRSKAIVDLNPRAHSTPKVLADLRAAGFSRVASRPVAVPSRVRIGGVGVRLLEVGAAIAPIRRALLARRLNVAVCGVKE